MTKREKELLKRGSKNLRKKLRLEKRLAAKLRRFFNSQNDLVEDVYRRTGTQIDASVKTDELEQTLNNHYREAANAFSSEIVRELNRVLVSEGFEKIIPDNPELSLALLMFINQTIKNSAHQITTTSNKEIASAFQKAGGDLDDAMATLRTRGKNRAHTIAMNENQKAVEGVKQTTGETVHRVANSALLGAAFLRQFKTWVTRMDAKVRSVHRLALFQTVPADEPFIVGGEMLMHPGDWSLGASPENVMNCRCNAVYEFRFSA